MRSVLPPRNKQRPRLSQSDRELALAWARMELAKQDIIQFSCYTDPTQTANYNARHLRQIADRLEDVDAGRCLRLHITAPPRHWKSSLAVEKFIAYYLGRHPDRTVAIFSHAQNKALEFSRTIRGVIATNDKYRELFPGTCMSPVIASAGEWALAGAFRSTMVAMSVGSSPTGRGFQLILIDDPIADVQTAYSKNERDKIWSWYREVLRDRLEPGGAIVLIMSRWHGDDLAGRLIKESDAGTGEKWDVLHLKALDAQQNALWEERWPKAALLETKQAQGARAFAARFQGEPRLDEGNMLNSALLRMIDQEDVPAMVAIVRYWDLAFSDVQGSDYVAGVKMGADRQGNRYILHVKRIQGRWTNSAPVIMRFADTDGVECQQIIEANGTQLGYAQEMKERIPGRTILEGRPEGNKEMRAAIWGTRLEDGIIFCVRGPWNVELFDCMDFFPNGEHDDIVDGVSGAWAGLNTPTGAFGASSDLQAPAVNTGMDAQRTDAFAPQVGGDFFQ